MIDLFDAWYWKTVYCEHFANSLYKQLRYRSCCCWNSPFHDPDFRTSWLNHPFLEVTLMTLMIAMWMIRSGATKCPTSLIKFSRWQSELVSTNSNLTPSLNKYLEWSVFGHVSNITSPSANLLPSAIGTIRFLQIVNSQPVSKTNVKQIFGRSSVW